MDHVRFGAGDTASPLSPLQPSAPEIVTSYPDMPPPTYNEAVGSTVNLREADDNHNVVLSDFKPVYPTFTWNFGKDA